MKFLLVNWTTSKDLKGVCEAVFSDLGTILTGMGHETKSVSFNSVKDIIGGGIERDDMKFFEVEASHMIDRYCSHYMKLFPETRIISNAGVTNFWYKKPNTINIFNDPYRAIVNGLLKWGLYGLKTYNKYGNICALMQEGGAEGAKNIAVSEFMANEMMKIGITPDRTIRHGVDTELFKPMKREEIRVKYGIPNDMPVIVWSKDFHPVAGFHILSQLIRKFSDVFWVLNFKSGQSYRPKAKNVKIVQPMERERMAEFYNLGDLCINPSIVESFGLAPLEAMSCGIPCVLNNTGFVWDRSIEDEITERPYGLIVNQWQVKPYEKAIKMMLDGGKKLKPRKWVIDNGYTIERWSGEWKDLIKKI